VGDIDEAKEGVEEPELKQDSTGDEVLVADMPQEALWYWDWL
jgi:hypothetical protein